MTAVLLSAALLTPAAPAQADSDPWPSPIGANNWSCRPSQAHPNPVVLLHGYLGNRYGNWQYMAPKLALAGYCVFAPTYGMRPDAAPPLNLLGGIGPAVDNAAEIGRFVDRVREATGAAKVDLVGHSEGSLVPQYYLKHLGGAGKVDKYVALTPLWYGTAFFGASEINRLAIQHGLDPTLGRFVDELCGPCRSFLTGADFLDGLDEPVPGVAYTTIMTRYDEFVHPWTSGYMDGATNIVLQDVCAVDLSEHIAVAYDPVVFRLIRNALDPGNARRVTCLT
jgi:triacylglycerol lipase